MVTIAVVTLEEDRIVRTFPEFPDESLCPVCGEWAKGECVLVPIAGTGDGRICEAAPTHLECLIDEAYLQRLSNGRSVIIVGCLDPAEMAASEEEDA